MDDQNSPFRDGVQFAWDSTSYGWLLECPRKYHLSMELGYRPVEDNVHLSFGLLFQECDEFFEKAIADGASYDEALRHVVRHALQDSRNWSFTHQTKTREALIRSIIWYRERWRNDNFTTVQLRSGKPGVELSFALEIGHGKLLCGHLDKLGAFAGSNYFKDIKTTSSSLGSYFFEKFDLDVQMDFYATATRIAYETPVAGGLIDGIQIGNGFTKFDRGFTNRTNDQINNFIEEFHYYTGAYLAMQRSAGWPMNKKSCNSMRSDDPNRDAHGCIFRKICSRSSESLVQEILETNYKREQWNPLESR